MQSPGYLRLTSSSPAEESSPSIPPPPCAINLGTLMTMLTHADSPRIIDAKLSVQSEIDRMLLFMYAQWRYGDTREFPPSSKPWDPKRDSVRHWENILGVSVSHKFSHLTKDLLHRILSFTCERIEIQSLRQVNHTWNDVASKIEIQEQKIIPNNLRLSIPQVSLTDNSASPLSLHDDSSFPPLFAFGRRATTVHTVNNETIMSGFIEGDMHRMDRHISACDDTELAMLFPVVCGSISLLPFGAGQLRRSLTKAIHSRVEHNSFLFQHFHFFVNSYQSHPFVNRICADHPVMDLIHSSQSSTSPSRIMKSQSAQCVMETPDRRSVSITNRQSIDLLSLGTKRESIGELAFEFDDGSNSEYEEDREMSVPLSDSGVESMCADLSSISAELYRQHSRPQTPKGRRSRKKRKWRPSKMLQKFRNRSRGSTSSNDRRNIFFGNNAVELFESFLNPRRFSVDLTGELSVQKGFTIHLSRDSSSYRFYFPFNPRYRLMEISVKRIIHSNAKPLILSCKCMDEAREMMGDATVVSQMILKKGDDLRRDAAVLTMFRFMNLLWKRGDLKFQDNEDFMVTALTYKVFPIGNDIGLIEIIDETKPLSQISGADFDDEQIFKLIASCAGSYIAAYVMGIRDRHYDNVLFRDDGMVFHIDFGYMLGDKVSGLDTNKFAITSDLQHLIGKYWPQFVDLCVEAWKILRRNYEELVEFGKATFALFECDDEHISEGNDGHKKLGGHCVEKFIREMLRIGYDERESAEYIRKKIDDAPRAWRTKMKNTLHAWNTRR